MTRYFFHILTDKMRLRDDEGGDFASLAVACEEAAQAARDVMAEELRCGRPMPISWRVQIATEDETILTTLPFKSIAFPPAHDQSSRTNAQDHALFARARATFQRLHRSKDEITVGLHELRQSVRQLAQLTSGLGRS